MFIQGFHFYMLIRHLHGLLPASPNGCRDTLSRSIERATFSIPTYDTALEQASVILDYFFGA
jgi:hypothetical protein